MGKGTYKGKPLYSVGQYDVTGAVLSPSILENTASVKRPLISHGRKLNSMKRYWLTEKSGEFRHPFDINTSWSGEWYSYGFGPFLQSFGGDQINRANYVESEGAER